MSTSFLEKSKDPEHASFTKLKDIKITTVDSFQVSWQISTKLADLKLSCIESERKQTYIHINQFNYCIPKASF